MSQLFKLSKRLSALKSLVAFFLVNAAWWIKFPTENARFFFHVRPAGRWHLRDGTHNLGALGHTACGSTTLRLLTLRIPCCKYKRDAILLVLLSSPLAMFLSASSVVLSIALTAFAAPHPTFKFSSLQKRSSETCGGLNGIAGFFDTAFNFTLATLNQTMPNANGTGAPLVLGPVGERSGVHLEALSVSYIQ